MAADDVARSANARINEHFFGALQRDENPLATLIARFTAVMGVTQGADESSLDFGTRLEDALYFADYVTKKDLDGKPMKIGLATFRVSVGDLNAALDGSDKTPTAEALFLARFVTQNGLQQADGEDEAGYRLRMKDALTAARQDAPNSVAEVEKRSGLTELGISAAQMIEAIKRPYGDAAQAIKAMLADKAEEDKSTTSETTKVLQRLEDIADPKTEEELKLERLEKDPTRVEDAETRKEREADIRTLEAADKLEDIEKLQDAVKEGNEAAAEDTETETGAGSDPVAAAIETIQVLAAGAEVAQTQADAEADGGGSTAGSTAPDGSAQSADETPSDEETKEAQLVALARAGQGSQTPAGDVSEEQEIFALSIDEDGLYDYLAKRKAA
ncbi:hypothetical protein P6U16_10570 [Rhizobium sp. 32-5/1]|uniref:hypothetical protein n=1 Tax=Rhizobium sp. 32-5/1 TaxID=3019602 RepID=UPI00240E3765|nr:hypothetical protein [Rhizobium sp. 32-5/1]WEZ84921.1 hypothetical protein P6U16_10570 [Rhizobium sp. 32-5/1]